MDLSNFKITKINNIKVFERKIIVKNVPNSVKVSHKKFKRFLRNINYTTELVTIADQIIIKDEYGNVIASITFSRDYYINPELYRIGQEQKRYIRNEYEYGTEPLLIFDDIKTAFLDNEKESVIIDDWFRKI